MIRALSVLALNGFREARRNRVTLSVGFFAAVLLLSGNLVTSVTVLTYARVLTDFGLGSMSILLVLLAIFLSSGQLGREIERRTLFLIVSKPISRGVFLTGRLLGNVLTLTVLLVLMALVFWAELLLMQTPVTSPMLVAIAMLWVELCVLTCIGFALSSVAGQMVSALVTVGVYFAGHLAPDIYNLALKAKTPFFQAAGVATYYVLPNLDRLNYRPRATYGVPTTLSEALHSVAYGGAYAAAMLVLAIVLFNRRDFK